MNPANPSARTLRAALAACLGLSPSASFAQRAVEVPVVPNGAARPGLLGQVTPGAGLNLPDLNAAVSGQSLAPAALRADLMLAASAAPTGAAGALATSRQAAGLAQSAPAKSRGVAVAKREPATARAGGAGVLANLEAGVAELAEAAVSDGVAATLGASERIFTGGTDRRDVKEDGDSAPSGAGAGGGAPASGGGGSERGGGLPNRAPLLRMGTVFFPGTRVRFTPRTQGALELVAAAASGEHGKYLVLASNRSDESLFPVASVVRVVDFSSDGRGTTAIFEVVADAVIKKIEPDGAHMMAVLAYQGRAKSEPDETRAMLKVVKGLLGEIARLDSEINAEWVQDVLAADNADQISTALADQMPFSLEAKQEILAARSTVDRLRLIAQAMNALKAEGQIASRTREDLGKGQREMILRAKMKAIQKELGEGEGEDELQELAAKIDSAGMPEAVRAKAMKELKKLQSTNPQSSEFTVGRNYIDWLTSVPWSEKTVDRLDLEVARDVLDRDHYGLDKVKERILEFLAVRQFKGDMKGVILLFVGPPGTGKTSIASGIAEALGRKFVRFSAGGVRDESEIRGHRRTYVGAIPGSIMAAMKEAGTVNPLFLIDEIDKLGRDPMKGDPSSALLELLDPKQNSTFRDHYLDVPYDMSNVIFVVTANDRERIPEALFNRMEVIEFSAYTTHEKVHIAGRHIVPEKREANGLKAGQATLSAEALRKVVEGYTLEAGVRNLANAVDGVMRKVAAWSKTKNEPIPDKIEADQVEKYLGKPKFRREDAATNGLGLATGLWVTGYGGGTLNVEAASKPGTGQLVIRKQMGKMADDSSENVLFYVTRVAPRYGAVPAWFRENDISLSFTPANEVEGPSAGTAMATALMSLATGRKVKDGIAMTGEITSQGRVLPIGGLKEKILGAHRAGYHTVIFPAANEKDLEGIPAEVREAMRLIPVRRAEEVFAVVLEDAPAAKPKIDLLDAMLRFFGLR